MDYLDFDLDVEAAGGGDYRVAVRSPEGETRGLIHFPYGEMELKNHLLELQNALLKSSGQHRATLAPEAQAVQEFGGSLFDLLLGGAVGALYDACRTRAAQEGRPGVRLRLRIQVAELAALPWEYLYDTRRGEYLCLSRRTPLVRYLEVAQPVLPLSITPPLRILAMIASPSDQPQLDVQHERERLEQALVNLEVRGLVKLEWLEGQTWRDLQRAMRGGPWHIFHFIGHGGFHPQAQEGVLALANEEGGTHLLGATQLAYLLANHDPLRMVMLNACEGATSNQHDLFSSTAATLAKRGIPAVLAMQYAISDRAAIECSRAFYEALADGLPVDSALAEARTAIHVGVNNSLEWGTPVLFLRTPGSVLFELPALAPTPLRGMPEPVALQERSVKATITPARATTKRLIEAGIAHHIAGSFSEALSDYDQAIQLDPDNAAAYFGKGNMLWGLGREEEARAVYEEALHLDPNDAAAYYNKAVALSVLHRDGEALVACEQALRLNPDFMLAYNCKGSLLIGLQRSGEALVALERAIQLDATFALAYSHYGNALFSLERDEEALVAYDRALQLDATDAAVYANKGAALLNLKRYEEALVALGRALHLDPNLAGAHRTRADVLFDLKRYEEALTAYEHALSLDPSDTQSTLNQGHVLSNLRRYEEALAAFDRALQLDATDAAALRARGDTLRNLKRYEEAVTAYDSALQLDPNGTRVWQDKGFALSQLQHYEEALVALEHALQLDPSLVFESYLKGDTLFNLSRYEEALTVYDRALHLDPNYVRAWTGKGNALYELKRYKEALVAVDQAIRLDSNHLSAWLLKSLVCTQLKQYKDVVDALDRTIQLNPSLASSHFDKGKALYQLKRYEEAVAAYDRTLQLAPNSILASTNKGLSLFCLRRYEEAVVAYDYAIQLAPEELHKELYELKGLALRQAGRKTEANQAYKKARERR